MRLKSTSVEFGNIEVLSIGKSLKQSREPTIDWEGLVRGECTTTTIVL